MAWYWMSFCDPKRPEGTQFLGVAIVEAADEASAVLVSHQLGINPGGEIQMYGFDPTRCPVPIVAVENKLFTMDQLKTAGLLA